MKPELPAWWLQQDRHARWLLGVSGGLDSVALLHLLVEAGFERVVVCHVNHQLRGDDSEMDERFVVGLAKSLGFESEVERVDVRARMFSHRESLETAARELRHACFARWAESWTCRDVLLAHHADDQAETIAWHLLRGSYGLRGMQAEQRLVVEGVPLRVLRPLLALRKATLRDWLVAERHSWREDLTNTEAGAVRNRLRNEVFPLLAAATGRDPVTALLGAEADWAEMRDFLRCELDRHQVTDPQGRLHVPTLREMHPVMQREAIRQFLGRHGVTDLSRRLLDEAHELLDAAGPHVINLPGGKHLRRRQARIWVE